MWRVKISRAVNHRVFGGKPDEMISTRCYVESRYGWMLFLDLTFYVIRKEKHHCRNSYHYDEEVIYETQVGYQASQGETGTDETNPSLLETVSTKGGEEL